MLQFMESYKFFGNEKELKIFQLFSLTSIDITRLNIGKVSFPFTITYEMSNY